MLDVLRWLPTLIVALACSSPEPKAAALAPVQCDFSACGGDLVGTWRVTSGCVDGLAAVSDCPGANTTVASVARGSLEFAGDGTHSLDLTISGSVRVELPVACTGNASCVDVGASLGAACLDSGSGCSCSSALDTQNITSSGRFVTHGTQLVTTDAAGHVDEPKPYCVSGAGLQLQIAGENGARTVLTATRQP